MKKRLFIGLGLISLIFVFSDAFILHNLAVITREQKAKEEHDSVLDRYVDMTNLMKTAQSELYRHQAGYGPDMNNLVEPVRGLRKALSLAKNDYTGSSSKSACNSCHSLEEKQGTFYRELAQISAYLNDYEKGIGILAASNDMKFDNAVERTATEDGEKIIDIVRSMRVATEKMNEKMDKIEDASIRRSEYAIIFALGLSLVLSFAIGLILFRSLTRPLGLLVKGIEKVSSGDYGTKVDIATDDEIGFLAGAFNSMTGSLAGMTEQRETLLAQLQTVNNSLEQRVKDATEQLKMAHERMLRAETLSAVGTFASGVAHELATPLSSILSYFQIVKERIRGDERLGGDITLIEGELVRCRNVLRGMLDFARAPETEKTATNVNTIISELLALVQYQKEYRGVTTVLELDHGVPDVMAVPGQLKQVFLNVILNALQSMNGGGVLTISSFTKREGKEKTVAVSVRDTGPGISGEEMNKIFQPFYTTRKSGTGLGLSISYGIVKGHGGNIEVKSEAGKGTTFNIYLPAMAIMNHGEHEGREDRKLKNEIVKGGG